MKTQRKRKTSGRSISNWYYSKFTCRPDVMPLLQERLPEYIVRSFIESGFDDIDAIMEMDVTDSPSNSITAIEQYIDKRKSVLKDCIRPNTSTISPFEFPPEHCIRIKRVVQDIRDKYNGQRSSSGIHRTMTKKISSMTEDGDRIPTLTADIRKKIVQWSTTFNNSQFAEMKENTDYQIIVSKSHTTNNQCKASVRCACGKSFALHRKPSGSKPWIISNWSKHCKDCRDKELRGEEQEVCISNFFPSVNGITPPMSNPNTVPIATNVSPMLPLVSYSSAPVPSHSSSLHFSSPSTLLPSASSSTSHSPPFVPSITCTNTSTPSPMITQDDILDVSQMQDFQ